MSFSFPPEIEDVIFKHAVRIRPYRHTDACLPLISRRVQSCVEPMLYGTVKLHGKDNNLFGFGTADEKKFAVALNNRPPSFFEKHVKNLCITGTVSKKHARRLLSVCTGVQNLALWNGEPLPSQITTLSLQSLDVNIETIDALSKLRHTFPELIYLSVMCFSDDDEMPSLEWLPALTHVRLEVGRYNDSIPEYLRTILRTSKSVQSILIQINDSDEWYEESDGVEVWAEEDPRITIAEDADFGYVRDWEERIADNVA